MGYEEGGGDSKVCHKRSQSFPDKRRVEEVGFDSSVEAPHSGKLEDYTKQNKAHTSLKQEILQLERRLQDQFEVRCDLEKALGCRSLSRVNTNEISTPKPATGLIKEIAVLELEVVYLEQYLLSLYRKAFDEQGTSVSPSANDKRIKSPLRNPKRMIREDSQPSILSDRQNSAVQSDYHAIDNSWKDFNGIGVDEKLLDSGVNRCHSSLSQRTPFFAKSSPPAESLTKALRACHSQPLSMMQYDQNTSSGIISLAEHFGTRISDHVPETPNRLSEDLIKCMSEIYCRLADPPLTNNGLSSPNSSLSSVGEFFPHDQCDMWSPGFRNNSSFDVRLDNPFHIEGLKEFSGPYSTMVEVQCIHRNSRKLADVEQLLQNFKSLIGRLEAIDPRKLNHEEKLAFWVNIHNSLVMHAFLAYGIPQNNLKRFFILLKAAYNVGGHTVSAESIQSSILGCRMPRPGQWLRLLLSSKAKFKNGDKRQAYAIEHTEPLLHFALCSGSHSDPAVRMYTPKRIFQELEAAKEQYIQATFGVRKDRKILLPKTVESFAKDSGLSPAGVMEMIQQSLPESLRKSINKHQLDKPRKIIEWIPHNFTFRYLISKDLVK